ncbi:MAG: hypothetical protein Q8N99_09015 [Nanoarchaeota archaeon]|nr:hypothetical protein [Nanoarchaeota archaeon]
MKPLKPSHREKKRYIIFEGKDADKENIEKAILDFIGILGFAEARLKTLRTKDGKIIYSINRDSLNKIRASFLLSGKDIRIMKVSGNIKKLK